MTNNLENNNYLTFALGGKQYAIKTSYLLEIIRLPKLEYPQHLPNNTIGLLRYNNFTLNVFDLRFYLGLNVTAYNTSNKILIINTDEAIFGLIVDEAIEVLDFEQNLKEYFDYNLNNKVIDFLYPINQEKISVVNIEALLEQTKKDLQMDEFKVLELFPSDEKSLAKLENRNLALNLEFDLTQYSQTRENFFGFILENEKYCLSLSNVKEIIKQPFITKVPNSGATILGVIAKADEFVPVIDLKSIMEITNNTNEAGVIMISYLDYDFAIPVDELINDFIDLSKASEIEPRKKYVENDFLLNNEIYSLIDLDKILQEQILKEGL